MSDEELHKLALALIQPQLDAWLRELQQEKEDDAEQEDRAA